MRHPERNEPLLHLFFYLFGSFAAKRGECLCLFLAACLQLHHLLLHLLQCLVTVLDMTEFLSNLVTLHNEFLDAVGMVFLL